jgi:transposase
MLQRNQPYHDLGADYFIRREDPTRRARTLIRQLEAIGYTIHAEPPPAAA